MDAYGNGVAVGCESGEINFYNTILANDSNRAMHARVWSGRHKSKVVAIAVSPDGLKVAAGDASDAVRVYHSVDGKIVWARTHWQDRDTSLHVVEQYKRVTSDIAFSGDGHIMVIGRWDNHAYVVDATTWQELSVVERKDDVFCVATAHAGTVFAVGGRDKFAVVYELKRSPTEQRAKTYAKCSVKTDAFIKAISLTQDARLLAIGAVDESVHIYAVANAKFLHKLHHNGAIYSTAFSLVGAHLAVGTDEYVITVWELDDYEDRTPKKVLVLPRSERCLSVAFSNRSLVFGAGSVAGVFGGQGVFNWNVQPSFEVVSDMMENEEALRVLVDVHPTVTNSTNLVSSETLLQHTIRKSPGAKAEALLAAKCRFGLIEDTHGHTALMIALKHQIKPIVRKILSTIASDHSDLPHALRQFTRHRVEIAHKYPDIFIEFIRSLRLLQLDGAMHASNFAALHDASRMLTEGSEDPEPGDCWADLMVGYDATTTTPTRRHSVLATTKEPLRDAATVLDDTVVQVEVVACRVPLDGAVAQNPDMLEFPHATLTYLLMQAATSLDSYEVFEDDLVIAMLQVCTERSAACMCDGAHCLDCCLCPPPFPVLSSNGATMRTLSSGCSSRASSSISRLCVSQHMVSPATRTQIPNHLGRLYLWRATSWRPREVLLGLFLTLGNFLLMAEKNSSATCLILSTYWLIRSSCSPQSLWRSFC